MPVSVELRSVLDSRAHLSHRRKFGIPGMITAVGQSQQQASNDIPYTIANEVCFGEPAKIK